MINSTEAGTVALRSLELSCTNDGDEMAEPPLLVPHRREGLFTPKRLTVFAMIHQLSGEVILQNLLNPLDVLRMKNGEEELHSLGNLVRLISQKPSPLGAKVDLSRNNIPIPESFSVVPTFALHHCLSSSMRVIKAMGASKICPASVAISSSASSGGLLSCAYRRKASRRKAEAHFWS